MMMTAQAKLKAAFGSQSQQSVASVSVCVIDLGPATGATLPKLGDKFSFAEQTSDVHAESFNGISSALVNHNLGDQSRRSLCCQAAGRCKLKAGGRARTDQVKSTK